MERIKYLENMLEESGGDPFPLYALGMEYLDSDPGKSRAYFESVFKKFPDYLPVYYQLGSLLEEMGEEDRAIEILRKGIEVASEEGDNKTERELRQLMESIIL